MRAPVPSPQHATQRACDAIGCPSSTAGNSPDIRDKFPGHPSLARWLTSHHGLHTTTERFSSIGTPGRVAAMRPDFLFRAGLHVRLSDFRVPDDAPNDDAPNVRLSEWARTMGRCHPRRAVRSARHRVHAIAFTKRHIKCRKDFA